MEAKNVAVGLIDADLARCHATAVVGFYPRRVGRGEIVGNGPGRVGIRPTHQDVVAVAAV